MAVLIFIVLMISGTAHHFMCLLTISICSLEASAFFLFVCLFKHFIGELGGG